VHKSRQKQRLLRIFWPAHNVFLLRLRYSRRDVAVESFMPGPTKLR
jgi:hypothetical protein